MAENAALHQEFTTAVAVFSLEMGTDQLVMRMLTSQGRAHHGEILREATRLAEAGNIVTRVDHSRFDLESAAEAHGAVEQRTAAGKVVIDVAD